MRAGASGPDGGLIVKRLIDIVGASLGLIVTAPLLVVVALAIYVSMGRPIFFRQVRPGYKGELFTLRKFRTMRIAGPDESYLFTDADRLTSVGRFLRRTSLDELPELWHVLKGEMSLVGPRPLLPEFLQRYTAEQRRRHDVRPGMTGWAAVNGRQLTTFSKRLELDVWYVDNRTLALDLRILAMTLRHVLKGEGVVSGQSVQDVDDLGFADGSRPAQVPAPGRSPHEVLSPEAGRRDA